MKTIFGYFGNVHLKFENLCSAIALERTGHRKVVRLSRLGRGREAPKGENGCTGSSGIPFQGSVGRAVG